MTSEEVGAAANLQVQENVGMEELLQFLSCKKCRRTAQNPKLLSCLHTLCLECFEEGKPIAQCPVCRTSPQNAGGVSFQDNLFFVTLQTKLNTYKKIASNRDLVCNRCQAGAEFWCSECEEFLCMACYNAHQWYLKQKSHEVQKLSDLKDATAHDFLQGAKKSSTLFCSEPTHNNQLVSIYCRGCCKPLCCSCALLDGEHYNAKLYRDLHVEIEERKEELGRIKEELVEKKKSYQRTCSVVNEQLQKLERVRAETQKEIREKVEEMVQWIREKGEELLTEVDMQVCQEREEVERKLRSTDRIVKRMEASEQLVEKMKLFASDQEVIEMHPFIRQSLDVLKKERLPTIAACSLVENFAEVKGKLSSLFKRVKGGKDAIGHVTDAVSQAAAPVGNSEVPHEERRQSKPQWRGPLFTPIYNVTLPKTSQRFTISEASPVKRPISQKEKCIQASPKIMKLEDHENYAGETSSKHIQETATSSWSPPLDASALEKLQRRADSEVEVLQNSPHEICESEAASIIISSSEENEDDAMV